LKIYDSVLVMFLYDVLESFNSVSRHAHKLRSAGTAITGTPNGPGTSVNGQWSWDGTPPQCHLNSWVFGDQTVPCSSVLNSCFRRFCQETKGALKMLNSYFTLQWHFTKTNICGLFVNSHRRNSNRTWQVLFCSCCYIHPEFLHLI